MDHQGSRQSLRPAAEDIHQHHSLAWKSMVYSPDRLLYPMKRVDFDPNGERNPRIAEFRI